jgi:hypothetical protein
MFHDCVLRNIYIYYVTNQQMDINKMYFFNKIHFIDAHFMCILLIKYILLMRFSWFVR